MVGDFVTMQLDPNDQLVEDEAYYEEGQGEEVPDDPDRMVEDDEGEERQDGEAVEELMLQNDSVLAFDAHQDAIYSIAIHPSIPIVVTGGGDDLAYIWSYLDGRQMATLTGHTDSVVGASFSPQKGKYVLTGGMDGKIRVWKVGKQWEFVTGIQEVEEIVWLQTSPVDHYVAVGANDGSVWVHSIPNLDIVYNFYSHTGGSCSFGAFSHDGQYLVTTSETGSIAMHDISTGEQVFRVDATDQRISGESGWNVAEFNHADSMIVVGGAGGEVRILSPRGDLLAGWDVGQGVESLAWSDDYLAVGGLDGKIGLYTVGSWALRKSFNHEDSVVQLRFATTLPVLTSCSMDKTVCQWDVRTGAQVRVWRGHSEGLLGFVQSSDDKTIISTGDDGIALVFSSEFST